jgi:hypothetical protein
MVIVVTGPNSDEVFNARFSSSGAMTPFPRAAQLVVPMAIGSSIANHLRSGGQVSLQRHRACISGQFGVPAADPSSPGGPILYLDWAGPE